MTARMTIDQLRQQHANAMNERGRGGLQELVERECNQRKLAYYHPYDSRKSRVGWPDLVIVLLTDVIYVELKAEKRRPTQAQARWLNLLTSRRCRCYLWRPTHLLNGTIVDVFNGFRNREGSGRWRLGHGVVGDRWSLPVERESG